ncbi:hypothetical protein TUM12370_24560 [Salmonella enterica subsp. enterica serovar Choleraesuis]|nr:hypothetical protein TUM12370_24560 [Salmonella enterica subsp. enterica serovar Choleraesuis]
MNKEETLSYRITTAINDARAYKREMDKSVHSHHAQHNAPLGDIVYGFLINNLLELPIHKSEPLSYMNDVSQIREFLTENCISSSLSQILK